MKFKNKKIIVVYTKYDCPYCDATRTLLNTKGIEFEEVDITNVDPSHRKGKILFQNEHLPKIYIDSVFIGGYQDLVKLITTGDLQ